MFLQSKTIDLFINFDFFAIFFSFNINLFHKVHAEYSELVHAS